MKIRIVGYYDLGLKRDKRYLSKIKLSNGENVLSWTKKGVTSPEERFRYDVLNLSKIGITEKQVNDYLVGVSK